MYTASKQESMKRSVPQMKEPKRSVVGLIGSLRRELSSMSSGFVMFASVYLLFLFVLPLIGVAFWSAGSDALILVPIWTIACFPFSLFFCMASIVEASVVEKEMYFTYVAFFLTPVANLVLIWLFWKRRSSRKSKWESEL